MKKLFIYFIYFFSMVIFKAPASTDTELSTSLIAVQIKAMFTGIMNGNAFFCVRVYSLDGSDQGKTLCTFKLFGKGKLAYGDLFDLSSLAYIEQSVIAVYYKENIWSDPDVKTQFSPHALFGIGVCYEIDYTHLESSKCLGKP